jgi:hypothetical protein
MSIDITVYASDVKDLDEHIERTLDVSDYYGSALFDEDGRLTDRDGYEYFIKPTCYLGIMMDMQEQINELKKNEVMDANAIDNIFDRLTILENEMIDKDLRISKLEKEAIEKL